MNDGRVGAGPSAAAGVGSFEGAVPSPIEPGEQVVARVLARAEESACRAMLAVPYRNGWRDMSCAELAELVRSGAGGLVALGIRAGDRVALMSSSRVEWAVADLAILAARAVTVPLYENSSVEQCRAILHDSGARLALVDSPTTAERVRAASDIDVLIFDDSGFDRLLTAGGPSDRHEADHRIDALALDDVATVVYTSGTTGGPKGCVLTHGNLSWTTKQTRHRLDEVLRDGGSVLQLLPLAHIFARLILYVCLEAGITVGFARDTGDPRADVHDFRPTIFVGVPRGFEKIYESARAEAAGPVRRQVFGMAESAAREWSTAAAPPGPLLRARHSLADRLVYRRLREALGGRVRYAISGGAPIRPELVHFFRGAGLPILEGYGLTESTGPATVNVPGEVRVGSVGRPLPGVAVRIDDGEILLKGGNVFQRYHHEDAGGDGFDGEWFRTGDLGEVDADGFLYVRGRKKELITTATGKNVAPAPLEERVNRHPLVSQTMVVGDRRRFVAALVTLDPVEFRRFVAERGGDGDNVRPNDDEAVRAEVRHAIDAANESVSRAESIRTFAIVDREFTQEAGELTPTLKLRRRDVADHFSDVIESLYA